MRLTMMMTILLVAQGMTAIPAVAMAEEQKGAEAAQASVADILAEQREIRAALQAGDEKYRYLDPPRRRQVYAAQKKLFALLDGRDSLDGLGADDRITVFNALEEIKSNLARQEGDEMVCERAKLAGTHRSELVCMTRAERDRRAKSATQALMNRQACTEPGCLGD